MGTEIKKYDSAYFTNYSSDDLRYSKDVPLGVSQKNILKRDSKPFVLEFKFDFDALIADFAKELKHVADINLVVCWQIGSDYSDQFRIGSLMISDEGTTRSVYGSTHALYSKGERRFEIICLQDLLAFYRDPVDLVSRHTQRFKN